MLLSRAVLKTQVTKLLLEMQRVKKDEVALCSGMVIVFLLLENPANFDFEPQGRDGSVWVCFPDLF